MSDDVKCPMADGLDGPLMVNPSMCNGVIGEDCRNCGWNPGVNKLRRERLRQLEEAGRLGEWGENS